MTDAQRAAKRIQALESPVKAVQNGEVLCYGGNIYSWESGTWYAGFKDGSVLKATVVVAGDGRFVRMKCK